MAELIVNIAETKCTGSKVKDDDSRNDLRVGITVTTIINPETNEVLRQTVACSQRTPEGKCNMAFGRAEINCRFKDN